MFWFGGHYVDHDFIFVRAIHELDITPSDPTSLCLFREISEHQATKGVVQITNGYLIAPPKHPFFLGLLSNILQHHTDQPDDTSPHTVMARTGPIKFGKYWAEDWKSELTLLNGSIVMPIDNRGKLTVDLDLSYTLWREGTS